MKRKDLQKTNHRHEAIAEWLVSNPDKQMGDCAKFFKYTQPWLSRIVHSDLFQAYYRNLCDKRGEIAVHSIAAKLNYAVNIALDKTIDRLQDTEKPPSERFIMETGSTLLDKLGYGGKGDLHVHTGDEKHVHLTPEQLLNARNTASEVLSMKKVNVISS